MPRLIVVVHGVVRAVELTREAMILSASSSGGDGCVGGQRGNVRLRIDDCWGSPYCWARAAQGLGALKASSSGGGGYVGGQQENVPLRVDDCWDLGALRHSGCDRVSQEDWGEIEGERGYKPSLAGCLLALGRWLVDFDLFRRY